MNSICTNVPFKGNIYIQTWNKMDDTLKTYPTTIAQDKLLKSITKNFSPDGVETKISQNSANFIYQLLEKITGTKIRNISNSKSITYNGNHAIFKDEDFKFRDGIYIDMVF